MRIPIINVLITFCVSTTLAQSHFTETITYTNLRARLGNKTLVRGTQYIFEHRTMHIIPYTTTIHTGDVEHLIAYATSDSGISNSVHSVEYPQDEIYFDILDTLCEDNTTIREGNIYRRFDTKRNNEAWYDFRNCVFRRWKANVPDWNPGNNYEEEAAVRYQHKLWVLYNKRSNADVTGIAPGRKNRYWIELADETYTDKILYSPTEQYVGTKILAADTNSYTDFYTWVNSTAMAKNGCDTNWTDNHIGAYYLKGKITPSNNVFINTDGKSDICSGNHFTGAVDNFILLGDMYSNIFTNSLNHNTITAPYGLFANNRGNASGSIDQNAFVNGDFFNNQFFNKNGFSNNVIAADYGTGANGFFNNSFYLGGHFNLNYIDVSEGFSWDFNLGGDCSYNQWIGTRIAWMFVHCGESYLANHVYSLNHYKFLYFTQAGSINGFSVTGDWSYVYLQGAGALENITAQNWSKVFWMKSGSVVQTINTLQDTTVSDLSDEFVALKDQMNQLSTSMTFTTGAFSTSDTLDFYRVGATAIIVDSIVIQCRGGDCDMVVNFAFGIGSTITPMYDNPRSVKGEKVRQLGSSLGTPNKFRVPANNTIALAIPAIKIKPKQIMVTMFYKQEH